MWDEYALKRDELGHVVFILQLGKVKDWDGTPSIHNALFVKKMVSSICECEQKSHCIVYAKIHRIHKENGWAYTSCKKCNKKVNVVESKASSSNGKNKVTFYYEDDGAVQVASRELLDLVGKRFLFKLYYSDCNIDNNNHTYRCDAVNDNPEMIKHFKEGFLDEETPTSRNKGSGSGGSPGTIKRRLNPTNDNDSDINCVIDMDTSNSGNEGSGSGGSSGRKRVFIDLDEIDSEEDEEGSSNKTPKLVTVKNSRIQVYIKKDWMFRFEPLFKEGQCYSISNFAIAENNGRLPLLPRKYKISFYKGTVVIRIKAFDDNVNGFILEPFNRSLDGTRQYHEHEAVNIIRSVVAIGDIVHVQSAAGRKKRRTVVIEDSESNKLDCTFWDHWANMWDEYALKRDELGHVMFILQLGKLKDWDGTPSIHNALFGTKMFINHDFPKMLAFRQRQFKISLFTPQKLMVTVSEFFHGTVKKMVPSIRECEQKSHCIIYAKIHMIHKENGWAYTSCKKCNKKVNVVESKASSSNGKNKVSFYYEDDGAVQVASRYKVIMRIIDQSGFAPIVFLTQCINRVLDMQTPTSGNKGSGSGGSPGTIKRRLNPTNDNDSDINCVIDMDTPNSGNAGLGSSGSSGRKRVFIDLDEIDSEEDKEGINNKTPKLVIVKVEKEDS
nr:hypothetical protein [Tanacetum cinerariifolium]